MEKPPGEPPSRWTVINDYSKTVVALAGALLAFIAAFSDRLSPSETSGLSRWLLIVAVAALVATTGFALAVMGWLDRYLRIMAAGDPAASSASGGTVTAGSIAAGTLTSGTVSGGTSGPSGPSGATISSAVLTGATITGATIVTAPTPGGGATQKDWKRRGRVITQMKIFANISYTTLFVAGMSLAWFAGLRVVGHEPGAPRNEAAAISAAVDMLRPLAQQPPGKWVVESLTFVSGADAYEIVVLDSTSTERYKMMVPRKRSIPMNVQRIQK